MGKSALKISEPLLPAAEDVAQAQEAIRALERNSSDVFKVRLEVDDGSRRFEVVLPAIAVQLLERMLKEMAQGHAITLIPIQSELTMEQAADLLNVSRPYLAALLESNAIPYRTVDTHRRVVLEHLMAYKESEDTKRLEVLRALTCEAQELRLGY